MTRPAPPASWVSISQYARLYGLTRNTVYKLLGNRSLETYRVLKIVRIRNVPPHQQQAGAEASEVG